MYIFIDTDTNNLESGNRTLHGLVGVLGHLRALLPLVLGLAALLVVVLLLFFLLVLLAALVLLLTTTAALLLALLHPVQVLHLQRLQRPIVGIILLLLLLLSQLLVALQEIGHAALVPPIPVLLLLGRVKVRARVRGPLVIRLLPKRRPPPLARRNSSLALALALLLLLRPLTAAAAAAAAAALALAHALFAMDHLRDAVRGLEQVADAVVEALVLHQVPE